MKKVCWFAFLIILSVSCLDDPDCYQLHNNFVGVTFRVIGSGQVDSTYLKNVDGAGKEGFFPYLNYQLNYFQEQADFDFEGEKQKMNHLRIDYVVKNQFVSEDCGSRFVLSDVTIADHTFDSARVVNATPGKGQGGANIDIYRCPETDSLTLSFNQLYASSDGIIVSNKSSKPISHKFTVTTDFSSSNVFDDRAATLYLPVNLQKKSVQYDFTEALSSDSLVITYETVTETRYKACKEQTFVNALKAVSHSFDSVSYGLNSLDEPQYAILDPRVINFRVFDCPITNMMQVNFVNAASAAQSVLIKGIRGEHFPGSLLTENITASTVSLPVDITKNESTFYIDYESRTDTLHVQYSLSPIRLYNACGTQRIVQDLVVDLPARLATNGSALKFPTVPNVQITIN
jgi:hypothetical protein